VDIATPIGREVLVELYAERRLYVDWIEERPLS
jgi:hypothetical protein